MNFSYFMPTKVVCGRDCVTASAAEFAPLGTHALIVTGKSSAKNGALDDVLTALGKNGQRATVFDRVIPNPTIACVREGIALLVSAGADFVVAIGGGSPMDAAKAIATLAVQERTDEEIFAGGYAPAALPMAHVPTTAGTGADSTRYSIFYRDGKKISLDDPVCLPDVALLWEGWLEGLPHEQKVSTMLDALCQGIESAWSVRSDEASETLALLAVQKIAAAQEAYLFAPHDQEIAREIMEASSLAGQAIERTKTTAAHAMCYRLTSDYGVPHGKAVALTLPHIWKVMLGKEETNDPRGMDYVRGQFLKIARAYGTESAEDAIAKFSENLSRFGVVAPKIKPEELPALVKAVNVSRLSNNPIPLSEQDLEKIYSLL